MAQPSIVELGTLLIFADLLATALGLEDPTIAFGLSKAEDGLWECALQVGAVKEKVRNSDRLDAVRNLTTVVALRLARTPMREE